jgi:hypothetical protein
MLKAVRWDDDDAIIHDPLRIRDDVISLDDATVLDDACAWNVTQRTSLEV